MSRESTPLSVDAEERRAAYAILRLSLGVNILLHGLVRLPHPLAFARTIAAQFAGTVVPEMATLGFSLALPFLESGIGLLLVLGWQTRWALRAGSLVMVALIAGTALRSDWHTLGVQVVYSIFYYLLHRDVSDNGFAFDAWYRSAAL